MFAGNLTRESGYKRTGLFESEISSIKRRATIQKYTLDMVVGVESEDQLNRIWDLWREQNEPINMELLGVFSDSFTRFDKHKLVYKLYKKYIASDTELPHGDHNHIIYNIFLKSVAASTHPRARKRANKIFQTMLKNHISPDAITYFELLKTYLKTDAPNKALKFLKNQEKITNSNLLDSAMACRFVAYALDKHDYKLLKKIWNMMSKRNIVIDLGFLANQFKLLIDAHEDNTLEKFFTILIENNVFKKDIMGRKIISFKKNQLFEGKYLQAADNGKHKYAPVSVMKAVLIACLRQNNLPDTIFVWDTCYEEIKSLLKELNIEYSIQGRFFRLSK